MVKRYGDVVSGGFFLLLGIWMFFSSYSITTTSFGRNFGADLVPRWVAMLMIALSVVVVNNGLRHARAAGGEGSAQRREAAGAGYVQTALSAASILLYAIFLDRVGFVIMTSLLTLVQMLILSNYELRKAWIFALVSVAFSCLIFYLFTMVFNLMLPHGILG